MRKLNFTILFASLMAFGTLLHSQDTVRHLVISEVRVDRWGHAYVEFTNMSETETVDLSEFSYSMLRDNQPTFTLENDEVILTPGYELWSGSTMRLHGMLDPGDSYVLMAVQDAVNGTWIWPRVVQSLDLLERSDTVVHFNDWNGGDKRYRTYPYLPQYEMWGFDSISSNKSVVFHRHNDAPALFWHYDDQDTSITVLIDQALGTMAWDESGTSGNYINETDPPKSVAGVESAHDDYTLIRKFSVKEGETNWSLAAGIDASTSSWMIIPHHNDLNRMTWETEGNHGDFHLDYSSTVYDIDDAAGTITVPWGTEKHDSIRTGLILGPGMAWEYRENSSFQDSLSTIVKTGDKLVLYSAGMELESKEFELIVADPAGDMVQAFSKKAITYPDEDDVDYNPDDVAFVKAGDATSDWMSLAVGITKGFAGGDSIFEIPFATPVDTLFKLIEIAPNATYDFVWVDGEERSEVKYGDKLVITGGDGTTTKEYFLAVAPIEESDNVDLASITWPDRPAGFLEGWKGDTIPGFLSKATSYYIVLPPGTKSVPSLVIELEDINASYTVDRATSLKGANAERTTTINITSESDTTFSTVSILFDVFNPEPQKFEAEPLFSKFAIREWWSAGGMEILNAGDVLLDLSNYMIVKSDEITPADAVLGGFEPDSASWLKRWAKIVPGYKWETYDNWQIQPGKLIIDDAIDPFIEPKDVKAFWVVHPSGDWRAYWNDIDPAYGGRADYIVNNDDFDAGVFYNPWGEPLNRESTFAFPLYPRAGQSSTSNYYMLKILNDSVQAGTKLANDPADYEVVDTYGSPIVPWVVNGRVWSSPPGESYSVQRKPDRYIGSKELGSNFGDEDSSAYTLVQDYEQNPQRRTFVQREFGSHAMDAITGHLSTVSAVVYNVSRGYEGVQTIDGVYRNETVADLLGNLLKADPTQVVEVKGKTGADAVVDGDTVIVTAQTGFQTKYVVSTAALSDDNLLVAAAGSNIVVETESVGGFTFGTSLRAVLDLLTVPDNAVLNIVDAGGNLVPLQRRNAEGELNDVAASADYSFEVVAENGDIATYALSPGVLASDAFVLSDVYTVSEEPTKLISNIMDGTIVQSFLNNIVVVEGATVKVLIKSGQERTLGELNLDDVLEVTSEDGSVVVVYELVFEDELTAFVTSDVYTVSQDAFSIEVPENTTVESLLAGLSPAPEAVVVVLDVDMNVKTTGALLDTDMVKVTSGDGKNTATYTISVIVSVYNSMIENLQVYPNPARDVLYVKNIPADTHVRITDITGRMHNMLEASEISSGIDLSGMRNGMYFLSIEKDGKNLATVKFVKR